MRRTLAVGLALASILAKRRGAIALLVKSMITGTRTDPRVNPPGFDSSTMDRGHLIGHQFSGSDTDARNFVSQYMTSNEVTWKQDEDQVKGALDQGACVAYKVVPAYIGANVIPTALEMTAIGGKKGGGATLNLHVSVLNRRDGRALAATAAGAAPGGRIALVERSGARPGTG